MRILLHCCCGPCSTVCIQTLTDLGHKVTLFYSNSNIYPEDEFDKRGKYLEKVALHYGVDYMIDRQDHRAWLDWVSQVEGYSTQKEGMGRCSACFAYNLRRTQEVAKQMGFDGFTTTLTVSRFKKSAQIFLVGNSLEGFLPFDFKKKDGFARSCSIANELELYRQRYCGCEFSLNLS